MNEDATGQTAEAAGADATAQAQDTGNTLLTQGEAQASENANQQPQGQDHEKDPAAETGTQDQDPARQVPDAPDGYELSFTEDTVVDAGLLGAFRETAHELGLTRSQAQQLAALYEGHVRDLEAGQRQSLEGQKQAWEAEIKAGPSFAAELTHARRALSQYGSPGLTALLEQSLLGSNPELFGFVARVGRALAEPSLKGRGGSQQPLTAEKILYPDMA